MTSDDLPLLFVVFIIRLSPSANEDLFSLDIVPSLLKQCSQERVDLCDAKHQASKSEIFQRRDTVSVSSVD